VEQIHRVELLTRLHWLTTFVENLAVELDWEYAFEETFKWKNGQSRIRGELEDWLFADREAIVKRLIEAGEVGDEHDDPEFYKAGRRLDHFSSGPDGSRFPPAIKTADDAIKSLESAVLRLSKIERLVWVTAILPMPSTVCRHLSRLDLLRIIRLEQQGEFRSSSKYRNCLVLNTADHVGLPRTLVSSFMGDLQSRQEA
jgi:hypothetical protein